MTVENLQMISFRRKWPMIHDEIHMRESYGN